jgi:hypothetical protein
MAAISKYAGSAAQSRIATIDTIYCICSFIHQKNNFKIGRKDK